MKKIIFIIALTAAGCAASIPMSRNAKREFTYDYKVEAKTKDELWTAGRNYFAEAYNNSRAILRVEDKEEGVFIGKALQPWGLFGNTCLTEYQIKFAAKDGKARLQLELLEGVPPLSDCPGWSWPSKKGYANIVKNFNRIGASMGSALEQSGKDSSFMDF